MPEEIKSVMKSEFSTIEEGIKININEKIVREKCAKTYKRVQREIEILEKYTSKLKNDEFWKEKIKLIEKIAKEKGLKGVLVDFGRKKLSPATDFFGYLIISRENLFNWSRLLNIDPEFTKEGWELLGSRERKNYEGKNKEHIEELWELLKEKENLREELLKEGKKLREIKNDEKIKEINKKIDEVINLIQEESSRQFIAERENKVEDIAKVEVFALVSYEGIEKPKNPEEEVSLKEEIEERLFKWYSFLTPTQHNEIKEKILEKLSEIWEIKEKEIRKGYR